MDFSVQPWVSQLSMRELVTVCNEKMVCAARDLAEFTKAGIHATDIVTLATKCEAFERQLGQPAPAATSELLRLASEIRSALVNICKAGLRIWQNNLKRRQDYLLPARLLNGRLEGPAPRVDVA
jgi:hypothetical protein